MAVVKRVICRNLELRYLKTLYNDVWAADYGCFLVYGTLDCSGELRVFQNLDQVEELKISLPRSKRLAADIR
jgi:hypothetical protein